MRRVWNSTLVRRAELARGKGPSRTSRIRKMNPERQARRDAEYARKLAAYRRSPTYRLVQARAGGRCEFTLPSGERCPVTVGLSHHHLTYARFGGAERPEDVIVGCEHHHALAEQLHHPHRRHGRGRGCA